MTKTGSSVNVTCMAESYLPDISADDFQMTHPNNTEIDKVLTPGKNGVVHIITAANKEADAGEYECTVIVRFAEYKEDLQSNTANVSLVIYGELTSMYVYICRQ